MPKPTKRSSRQGTSGNEPRPEHDEDSHCKNGTSDEDAKDTPMSVPKEFHRASSPKPAVGPPATAEQQDGTERTIAALLDATAQHHWVQTGAAGLTSAAKA